jgi:hypothetical protein
MSVETEIKNTPSEGIGVRSIRTMADRQRSSEELSQSLVKLAMDAEERGEFLAARRLRSVAIEVQLRDR